MGAGIRLGDVLPAEVRGPGELVLVREADPIERFAGSLTGFCAPGELDESRDEWIRPSATLRMQGSRRTYFFDGTVGAFAPPHT